MGTGHWTEALGTTTSTEYHAPGTSASHWYQPLGTGSGTRQWIPAPGSGFQHRHGHWRRALAPAPHSRQWYHALSPPPGPGTDTSTGTSTTHWQQHQHCMPCTGHQAPAPCTGTSIGTTHWYWAAGRGGGCHEHPWVEDTEYHARVLSTGQGTPGTCTHCTRWQSPDPPARLCLPPGTPRSLKPRGPSHPAWLSPTSPALTPQCQVSARVLIPPADPWAPRQAEGHEPSVLDPKDLVCAWASGGSVVGRWLWREPVPTNRAFFRIGLGVTLCLPPGHRWRVKRTRLEGMRDTAGARAGRGMLAHVPVPGSKSAAREKMQIFSTLHLRPGRRDPVRAPALGPALV